MTVSSSARSANLQIIRGLAALSVMLFHAALFTSQKTNTPLLADVFSGRFGYYGVMTFFVLSGFVMEGAVRKYGALQFLAHRFVRLFPSYWGIFLFIQLAQLVRLGHWEPIPWAALSLLPTGTLYRPLHVEWTLIYEVFFYLVCAMICLRKNLHPLILSVWGLICCVVLLHFDSYGTQMQPTWSEIPFSGWNIAFIAGGLAGALNRKAVHLPGVWLLLGGIIALGLGELGGNPVRLIFTSVGLLMLLLAVVRTRDANLDGFLTRALHKLGECSYGLYLIHSMTIQIALQYVPADRLSEPLSVFVGMAVIGLAAGLLAGSCDAWLYIRLKRALDRTLQRYATPLRHIGSRTAALSDEQAPI